MIWYVGFHAPYLRDLEGKISFRGLFGHCEIWGQNDDGTWVFIDPQGTGTVVTAIHRFDHVQAALEARVQLCWSILQAPSPSHFRAPIHGGMTCAAICGSILGIRALLPSTLHQKLLAKGAKVIHDPENRPSGRC